MNGWNVFHIILWNIFHWLFSICNKTLISTREFFFFFSTLVLHFSAELNCCYIIKEQPEGRIVVFKLVLVQNAIARTFFNSHCALMNQYNSLSSCSLVGGCHVNVLMGAHHIKYCPHLPPNPLLYFPPQF